jgi:putative photosynthetic complex assembly protein 2
MLTAIVVTLTVWWAATGLLFYLNRQSEQTFPRALLAGMFVVGCAVAGIEASASIPGVGGVYIAFAGAIVLWGWLEMAHLMGYLTGPVSEPCPPDLEGWPRFVRAISVGLYHELAIIAAGSLLIVAAALAGNGVTVAAWAFATLWFMRWSAKLNLYLGVANHLDLELMPERLRYMASYMGKRSMNFLFPISVSLGSLLVIYHGWNAASMPSESAGHTAAVLLATLSGLGVLEHWFLVLPFKDSMLWRWLVGTAEQVQAVDTENAAEAEHGLPLRG